jgi:hypothetical protein
MSVKKLAAFAHVNGLDNLEDVLSAMRAADAKGLLTVEEIVTLDCAIAELFSYLRHYEPKALSSAYLEN